MNSKTVYSRNRLPRLEVEKTEWEREDEERRARLLAWKEQEARRQQRGKDEQEAGGVDQQEEEIIRDAWRHMKVNRNKEDRGEAVGEKPGKRRRVKDRVRETDTMWGQRELTAEENVVITWLHE